MEKPAGPLAASPSMSAHGPRTFLTLPKELRDQIYDYCTLTNIDFIFEHLHPDHAKCYPYIEHGVVLSHCPNPTLLRVNWQIYSEYTAYTGLVLRKLHIRVLMNLALGGPKGLLPKTSPQFEDILCLTKYATACTFEVIAGDSWWAGGPGNIALETQIHTVLKQLQNVQDVEINIRDCQNSLFCLHLQRPITWINHQARRALTHFIAYDPEREFHALRSHRSLRKSGDATDQRLQPNRPATDNYRRFRRIQKSLVPNADLYPGAPAFIYRITKTYSEKDARIKTRVAKHPWFKVSPEHRLCQTSNELIRHIGQAKPDLNVKHRTCTLWH